MLLTLYFLSIVGSYFLFREMLKLNKQAFNEVDFKDIMSILVLLVIPMYNLLFIFSLYKAVVHKTGDDFTDILKKMFLLK